MYNNLKVEVINVGSVFQHSTEVDISFLMTYYKKEGVCDDFDINMVFFKNSMAMSDMKVVHDDVKSVSVFFNATLTMINNLKDMPFNRQFLFFDIHTTCKNVTVDTKRISNLNDFKMKKTIVGDTHTFIWKYKVERSLESVLKYMVIPYILTLVLQLTHAIKAEDEEGGRGTWVSVGSTFMLTDVALFFTVPQTNKLTCIEKCLFLSLLMKVFVTLFAFYNFDEEIASKINNFTHHDVDAVVFSILTIFMFLYTFYLYHQSRCGVNNILVSGVTSRAVCCL